MVLHPVRFSRRVVGWQISESVPRTSPSTPRDGGVEGTAPVAAQVLDGLSDHGERGGAKSFDLLLRAPRRNDIVAPVGARRHSNDNALAESFNATLGYIG